jgi:predicted RNA-binding protein with PUA-like domain
MSTAKRARRYWLVKSEPNCFSFDDLLRSPGRTTCWDGVRNYQARNFMRDDMKTGDLAFFYHSSAEPPAIVGVAEVVREGYPDHTAFDAAADHFDPKSSEDSPTWIMVDLRAVERLARPLTLSDLRGVPGLEKMVLLQRGSRLSVQPVSAEEWEIVHGLGSAQPLTAAPAAARKSKPAAKR